MSPKRPRKATEGAAASNESPQERVRTFLKLFKHNERVLVLINPDPDSMASAWAVTDLLGKHVRNSLIAYTGEIESAENQSMMELLKIPMMRLDDGDLKGFTGRILVDSQPHHSRIFESFKYDAVIDHHPIVKRCNAPYVDIRPEYGATGTILSEYLLGAGIRPSVRLATALLYAIKTDTGNFEQCGNEKDVRQFRYLSHYGNLDLLRKIEKSELRPSDMQYFQIALENRISTKKGFYSHLGKVPSAGVCMQAADFFSRFHGLGWSFISGVSDDKLFVIIRNDGYRKDAAKLASFAFGDFGVAGGHRDRARVEIPLDALRERGVNGYGSSLEEFVKKRLKI
jgi:nanoRNase/pAp phosphatase (c-di-AMP/oligoRNAs hydrolase)